MDTHNSKSLSNDSRCVFFKNDSEDYRCVSIYPHCKVRLRFELMSYLAYRYVSLLALRCFANYLTLVVLIVY